MPGTGPMRKAETLPLPRFISAYLERHGVKIEQSDVPRVAWPSNSVCGATVEALSRSLSRLSIRRSYIAFQKICTRSQPFFYRQYTRCLLPVFLHLAHLLAGHGGPNDLRAFVSEFEKGFREPNEQKLIQEMLAQGEKFVVPDFKVRMDEIAMSYLMKQLREEGLDLLMYVFDSLIRADVGGLPSDGGVLAVEEVGERGGQGPEIAHITFYNHYGTVSDLKLAKSMNVLAVAQESGVTLDSLVERAVFPNDASACEVLRHRARVLRTCISPNSCLVCSTSVDGEIRFAHTEVCKEMCRFNLHLEPVFDLQFERRSSIVAAASMDKTVSLWSPNSKTALRLFAGHLQPVYCVCFGRTDRTLLTAASDKSVRLWDIGTGQRMAKMDTSNERTPTALRVSPVGDVAAVSFVDGCVQMIDFSNLEDPKTVAYARPTASQITDFQFTSDGKQLIMGSVDGSIRVLSVEEGLATKWVVATDASTVDTVCLASDDLVVTLGRSRRGE